jgi:hypothetical protein
MIDAKGLCSLSLWEMKTSEDEVDKGEMSSEIPVACLALTAVMPMVKLGRDEHVT